MIGLTRLERENARNYLGVNLSVLHKVDEKKPYPLSGFYVSCDYRGDYNVGNVKFVPTDDKYKNDQIGEVSELPPEVRLKDLVIDILGFDEFKRTPINRELFDHGQIARSIKYYARRPRSMN